MRWHTLMRWHDFEDTARIWHDRLGHASFKKVL